MLRVSRFTFGLSVVVLAALPAAAQSPVSLTIHDGKVSLTAHEVPLRTILTEWGRIGGTNVVGSDRLTGGLVSLELTDVPERQALDVLLRNVSGYLLASRPASLSGVSVYNRIIIMPPSVAPRPVATAASPVITRFPQNAPDVSDDGAPEQDGSGQPGRPGTAGGQAPSAGVADPGSPTSRPGVVVTPTNPFGLPVGSGSMPGVVTPSQQPAGPRPEPD